MIKLGAGDRRPDSREDFFIPLQLEPSPQPGSVSADATGEEKRREERREIFLYDRED